MIESYVSFREIRQIIHSVAAKKLTKTVTFVSGKVSYPIILRLPLKLYLYVPP
ncbi:MAG: hypothetical protein R3Y63_14485 [Eubacteriales bacterium]